MILILRRRPKQSLQKRFLLFTPITPTTWSTIYCPASLINSNVPTRVCILCRVSRSGVGRRDRLWSIPLNVYLRLSLMVCSGGGLGCVKRAITTAYLTMRCWRCIVLRRLFGRTKKNHCERKSQKNPPNNIWKLNFWLWSSNRHQSESKPRDYISVD